MKVHFTDTELERLGGHLVRLYFEVERGLRHPQDLRRYLTPQMWSQLHLIDVERHPEAGLVRAADVGRIAVSRHGDHAAYIAAPACITGDRWTTVMLALRVQPSGRWKITELARLRESTVQRQLAVREPRDREDVTARLHTIVGDLAASRKALGLRSSTSLPPGRSSARATTKRRRDSNSSSRRPPTGRPRCRYSRLNETKSDAAWITAGRSR